MTHTPGKCEERYSAWLGSQATGGLPVGLYVGNVKIADFSSLHGDSLTEEEIVQLVDNVRRLASLWNAAEEKSLKTHDIKSGIVQHALDGLKIANGIIDACHAHDAKQDKKIRLLEADNAVMLKAMKKIQEKASTWQGYRVQTSLSVILREFYTVVDIALKSIKSLST